MIRQGIIRALLLAAMPLALVICGELPSGASAARIVLSPAVRLLLRQQRCVNPPLPYRQRNWTSSRGEGSCAHASLITLLRWQGRHDLAAAWRQRYAGGETPSGLAAKLDRADLPYFETRTGDLDFLLWAVRTRRGAGVVVANGEHMVDLVGLDEQIAYLIDPNAPEHIQKSPRSQFLNDWRRSGGWAFTPLVGPPSAPAPWIIR